MPWMTITVTNIFTTQDELITVKRIIIMIGISLFTTKGIKIIIKLMIILIIKQGIDDSINLFALFYTEMIKDILLNVNNYI